MSPNTIIPASSTSEADAGRHQPRPVVSERADQRSELRGVRRGRAVHAGCPERSELDSNHDRQRDRRQQSGSTGEARDHRATPSYVLTLYYARSSFMALMAITQHHGRPGTPTDQAHIESFFSHLKGDWPHLTSITHPAALDTELGRIRGEYNTTRLHAAIGYVTPDDEHHGRRPAIRRARAAGMRRARTERIKQNRASKT